MMRSIKVDPKQVVDAIVASEDTVKFLLEGIRTYAPDHMHGLPKEDYIQEAEEAIAALREAAVVLARANRAAAAAERRPVGRPPIPIPIPIPDVVVEPLKSIRVVQTPQDRPFMSMEEVADMFGISKSTIYAKMRSGDFPLPIKTGQRGIRWRTDELMAWINACQRAAYGGCE
ncbi:AlpA family phage regulatory protein [bacterium]|nr:AlpA family phage regulatory protein [bacterium]